MLEVGSTVQVFLLQDIPPKLPLSTKRSGCGFVGSRKETEKQCIS